MRIHGSGQIPSSAWNTSNQHRIYDLRVFSVVLMAEEKYEFGEIK